jgi:hypothetical protein
MQVTGDAVSFEQGMPTFVLLQTPGVWGTVANVTGLTQACPYWPVVSVTPVHWSSFQQAVPAPAPMYVPDRHVPVGFVPNEEPVLFREQKEPEAHSSPVARVSYWLHQLPTAALSFAAQKVSWPGYWRHSPDWHCALAVQFAPLASQLGARQYIDWTDTVVPLQTPEVQTPET